jgi:predicted nucleic acid-binding protein
MPSAVVDASALVEVLIGGPAAAAVFERVFRARIEIHAPHSLDLEVANAVRRLARRELLADQEVDEIAAIYRDLKIERHGNRPFLHRIWQLRHNISPYDAAYVGLAEWLDIPLITHDARLSRSSAHHAARIEYFE